VSGIFHVTIPQPKNKDILVCKGGQRAKVKTKAFKRPNWPNLNFDLKKKSSLGILVSKIIIFYAYIIYVQSKTKYMPNMKSDFLFVYLFCPFWHFFNKKS
jgi:hypothetical protein